MFTGIVETTGKIVSREPSKGSTRLIVDAAPIAKKSRVGDSIAVNGCCLTVIETRGANLTFDLLRETEICTNLADVKSGERVNLEPAIATDGRFGGHFVTGHIDGTGCIRSFSKKERDYELAIEINPQWSAWLVPKGCIAVDGISLTVADASKNEFTAWIIPHTREITALAEREKGDLVNLEFDLLAKYTEKILATRGSVR